jgi:hypothetical protein
LIDCNRIDHVRNKRVSNLIVDDPVLDAVCGRGRLIAKDDARSYLAIVKRLTEGKKRPDIIKRVGRLVNVLVDRLPFADEPAASKPAIERLDVGYDKLV